MRDAHPRGTAGARPVPMKLLFDFFPILLFFAAYKVYGIYAATLAAIVATVGQIGWLKLRGRRVEPMQWASLVIIVVFGGLTLVFQDETFIKWKPTVLYALFGGLLALGKLAFRRDWIAVLLKDLDLPAAVWSGVTWSWIGFFAAMALANWYVAFHFSLEAWVNFKVWGGIGLFLAFALLQGLWLARHLPQEEPRR